EKLAENLAGANSLDVHFEVSARMNNSLIERSGNDKLNEIVFHLARQVARYTRLGLSTAQRRAESVASWRELIKLIESGDEECADVLERRRVRDSQALAIEILTAEQKAE
ncbi:MAG: FCD domain-containing protein, partial [Gaiellaceae bacterium]